MSFDIYAEAVLYATALWQQHTVALPEQIRRILTVTSLIGSNASELHSYPCEVQINFGQALLPLGSGSLVSKCAV
jgi:hypothetical protein